MGSGKSIIKVIIAGDASGALKSFAETEAGAEGLGGVMSKAGLAVAGVAAATAAAGVGIGVALFKIGDDFDQAYNKIKGKTGLTGQAFDDLKGEFKSVLTDVPTDMGKASDAVIAVYQKLGDQGGIAKGVAEQLLEVSRITKTDLTANLDAATSALKNWNIPAADQSKLLDEMYRASSTTGVAFDKIASSISDSGAQFRALGVPVESAIALVAQLGQAGIDTSDVMPALNKAMATAAKEGKSAGDVFRDTFDKIKNAPNDVDAASTALQVFGAKAGPKFAELIREGKFNYEDFLKTIQTGSTTILGAGKDTQDFGDKWDLIKNRVLVALEPVAMKVFDGIGKAMDALGPIITEVAAGFEVFFAAFSGGEASESAQSTLGKNADAIKNFGAAARQVFDDVAAGWSNVSAIVSKVVSAVSTAITWLSTQYVTHKAQIDKVFEGIHKVWASLVSIIKPAIDLVVALITQTVTIIQQLWDRFGEHLLDHLMTAFEAIVQVVQGAFSVVKGIFDIFAAIFTGDWGRLWDGIKEVISGVFDIIVGLVRAGVNAVSTIIGATMAVISELWSGAWHALATLVSTTLGGVWSTITGVFGSVVSFVADLPGQLANAGAGMWDWMREGVLAAVDGAIGVINAGIDFLNRFQIHISAPGLSILGMDVVPDWSYDWNGPHITRIPYLADGAFVRSPTLAMIGEAGDELVLPLSKPDRMLSLLNQAGLLRQAAPQQSAAQPVQVIQHITAYDPKEAARMSADEWYWAQKTSGR